MSIRSYKEIYNKFSEMFPELNKCTDNWKGIRFADRHIAIKMKNGSTIQFQYYNDNKWVLICIPENVPPIVV